MVYYPIPIILMLSIKRERERARERERERIRERERRRKRLTRSATDSAAHRRAHAAQCAVPARGHRPKPKSSKNGSLRR